MAFCPFHPVSPSQCGGWHSQGALWYLLPECSGFGIHVEDIY